MTRKAKRSSAANRDGSGLPGSVLGRRSAAAVPAPLLGSKGTGAPPRRAALVAIIAALALVSMAFASSASAAPPSTTCCTISDVSYTSAHVTGKVTTDGSGFNSTVWAFQYSTDQASWSTGLASDFNTKINGSATDKEVEGTIPVPKGATKYFVRLVAANGFFMSDPPEAISPGPNPSFTTLVVDPPAVEQTDNATEVEYTTATVKGKISRPVNPDPAFNANCHFQYVTDEQYQVSGFTESPGDVPCEGTNPIENPGSNDVEAHLTGLTNNTTYHLRLFASNASLTTVAKDAASTFTTLAVDPPTVVSVEDATDLYSRSADVAGVIKRPANPDPAFDIVACRFEYVTEAQFGATGFAGAGSAPCVEPINNGPDEETSVTANLTGLDAETTYHLRLAAENSAATPGTKEAASTFTTTAKVAKPTVLSVQNATGVDQDTAKVSGEVERPAGLDPALDVSCRYEYVSEASFQGNEEQSIRVVGSGGTFTIGFKGESTAPIAFDAPAASVKAALEGLSAIGSGDVAVRGGPGNPYGAAPYLIVFSGALAGNNVEAMTTDASGLLPPFPTPSATVETLAEGGHPPGFVNPGRTDCDPLASEAGPQEAKVGLSGLLPDTTYHLRLTAENGGGTDTKVAASTFTTDPNFPASAVVGPITEISGWGAKLSGEADVEGFYLFFNSFFEVSTDGVNWTNPTPAGGGGYLKLQPVGPVVITGLKGATKYFVRLHVLDPDGGYSLNVASKPPYPSFTTLPVDPVTILKANDATDVTAETAKVSGEIERGANPEPAFDANCHFEYVTEAQFQANGYQKALQIPCGIEPLATPGEKKAVEAELTDLKSGTKYHVRLVATNAGPDAILEVANTFTTVAVPATVSTTAGGSDNEGGYVLAGLVNPNNSTINDCKFVYGPTSETDFKKYPFAVPCSPTPDPIKKPVTVEGHVTGLTVNADYHFRLVVTNVFGTVVTPDRVFVPTIAAKVPCPDNEQFRNESSSLTLPECRAYELVTPMGKEGFGAKFETYDGGDRVAFESEATNIAKSGQGNPVRNLYVAARTDSGWETIPNLNGSSGSMRDAPTYVDNNALQLNLKGRSSDLRSSLWDFHKKGEPAGVFYLNLRSPDGTFTRVAPSGPFTYFAASSDLSHVVSPGLNGGGLSITEYDGTGVDQPRRVDVDNFGAPITECTGPTGRVEMRSISTDGSRIVFHVFGGCGGANPPSDALWARVNGSTSIDVSASQCDRAVSDPGGICNGPVPSVPCTRTNTTIEEQGPDCRGARFEAVTPDGSRVFFTTKQQLLDGDIDQTKDIYACDIPSGNPAPSGEKANHCSALRQISGVRTGAEVEEVNGTSEDGSTVLFTAKGVLADNDDALGEKAVSGDHNLFLWRSDAAHPDGQTAFIGRLDSNDLVTSTGANRATAPQSTPDGRYLVFTTASQLVETDTDTAHDVYRYDAGTGALTRVSTNTFGVAGNGDFPALAAPAAEHNPSPTISDDGTKIVFTTTEALSPADGNGEPDIYLWTPSRVSLLSTGSSGFAPSIAEGAVPPHAITPRVAIDSSGEDIYFESGQQLTPADGDSSTDVYDARIGGGFSFAQPPGCIGEKCQPEVTPPSPNPPSPANKPNGDGNFKPPKPCPKGKVRNKKGKCVRKHKKPHQKSNKKAGHKSRGSK